MTNENKQFMNIAKKGDDIELDIFGTIGESWWEDSKNTVKSVKEKLKELDAKNAKTISVNINSIGGDMNQGLAIYEALKEYSDKVVTKIIGFCASAATIIAMAGTTRKMADSAFFLIHKCASYVDGNENDFQKVIENHKKFNQAAIDIYVEAGIDRKTVEDLMEENEGHGIWLTFEEAKDYGFVTAKLRDSSASKAVACIDESYFSEYGYPAIPQSNNREEKSMLQKILEYVTPKNNKKMKNANEQFPQLALIVDEVQVNDKGECILTDEALLKIENKLKELQDAASKSNEEKSALESRLKDQEAKASEEKSALEKEVSELKNIIQNEPSHKNDVNGSDTNKDKVFGENLTTDYMEEAKETLGL